METLALYAAKSGDGGGGSGGEVTGVKGSAESSYRKGNVSISAANIGLGNVNNTSDVDKPVSSATSTALAGKVDKVNGKGLSTNDYDDTAKGIVDGVTAALANKVDKVNGKGLSTNDYDATAKSKLDALANIQSIGSGLTLDGTTHELSATGGGSVTVDDEMSSSSTNPVQNKVITAALGDKADKVTSATSGNFAGLDGNGNLTDSGKKAADFATADSVGYMTDAQWTDVQVALA